MKYLNTMITFSEFPDEIALCINITNCPFHCPGCHSPELWEDVGTELTIAELDKLIKSNRGITCVGFMGGSPKYINVLAKRIRRKYDGLKIGWYWGGSNIPSKINIGNFDYIKLGEYKKELGGLDNPNTNQRMYEIMHKISDGVMTSTTSDITSKFWKHGE